MQQATHACRRWQLIRLALAIVAAVCALVPFWWAVASALQPEQDLYRYLYPLSLYTLWPHTFTLANFAELWRDGFLGTAMVNSLIVIAASTALGLALSAPAAFAFSAFRFRGRGLLFGIVVVSFLIPFEAIAIPLSQMFRGWGLENTYPGLFLPGASNGLAIFLLRQFFLGIPPELAEATRIDGGGWFLVFWRIYLPLSRPALIGAGLILFLAQWQSFLWPLIIAPAPERQVAPMALAQFVGQFQVNYASMMAGAVLVTLVPAVLLLLFQRSFTQAFVTSGLSTTVVVVVS